MSIHVPDPETLRAACSLWDYMHMGHEPGPADCIVAGGSHDTRVAERAAELYLQGLAPIVVMTGGSGRHTEGMENSTEADRYADVALEMGVPEEAILKEDRSTNTGENAAFTRDLLARKDIHPAHVLNK